jgi:hypothetical protein
MMALVDDANVEHSLTRPECAETATIFVRERWNGRNNDVGGLPSLLAARLPAAEGERAPSKRRPLSERIECLVQ